MLIPLAAPATALMTLAALKRHLKVQHDEHDDLIADYLSAATAYVGRQAELVLRPTVLEERLDCWPVGCFELAAGPVRDVDEVVYLDADGVEQTADPAHWRWEPTRAGAELRFLTAFTRPTLQTERRGAVRVLYTAGFNDPTEASDGDDRLIAPAEAIQAVRMLVMHWYESRGVAAFGDSVANIPLSVETLIDAVRTWRS